MMSTRKYDSDAERQAAYRQRQAEKRRREAAELQRLRQGKVKAGDQGEAAKEIQSLRQRIAELRKELRWYQANLRRGALFSEAEYKTILRCLHPDNSASTTVRNRAFDLVRQKQRRLVGK